MRHPPPHLSVILAAALATSTAPVILASLPGQNPDAYAPDGTNLQFFNSLYA
jgi:hypothetical protein